MRYLYISIITFVLCACSPMDAGVAQDGVNKFHELYQQKKYTEIYKESSSLLKEATKKEDFINLLVVAQTKDLGVLKKSTLISTKKIYHLLSNNEVVLVYVSEYSQRNVHETFAFEVVDGEMKLQGYKYDYLN